MELKGYEKAAIFLNLLGEEMAGEILKNLDAKEVKKITLGISKIKDFTKDVIDEIKKEIKEIIESGVKLSLDEEAIKSLLAKSFGREELSRIFEEVEEETKVESFQSIDSSTLLSFILSEHPQTIASILCALEPKKSSEVFSKLPDTLKYEVSLRLATIEKVPEKAIAEVMEIFKNQIGRNKIKERKVSGPRVLADILNYCDKSLEEFILEKIEEKDSTLTDKIKALMFVFDDLVMLDDRGIQMLLKEVNNEDLIVALKSASEALREKIFKNMSQRAVQIIKEEMEAKGPVKVADVEKAQQNILKIARRLESEGKIILGGKGGDVVV
ncbi:MAG: flagellar motor switch protein FliG [Proteobacteria bacterium]|nr:flagellar motor switch protein FliG [Pseudomonadota bacterium]